MKDLISTHQQKIALAIGFVACATLGFFGGKTINRPTDTKPAVSASSSTTNYNQTAANVQTPGFGATPDTGSGVLDCAGKIKGSTSHKYHLPGGAFYDKTTHPIACFDTEAEAVAAGFTKSSR